MAAEVVLSKDIPALSNTVGEKVWVVCAIILGP